MPEGASASHRNSATAAGLDAGSSLAAQAGVVGQEASWRALRALARQPAQAVLLVGPDGLGAPTLARAYGAAVLCDRGGCGACPTCRTVLAGTHPDLIEIERSGPALRAEEARAVVALAQRRPMQASHQVVVVPDVHLAPSVVPVLLKTVEEPPPATVLVLSAESVPPVLATLASRCAQVGLRPVAEDTIAGWLRSTGIEAEQAAAAARAAAGRPERASVLASDPALLERQATWATVADRLDGRGATSAGLAAELLAAVDASVAVLADRQAAELAQVTARAEQYGEKGAGLRRQLEERHKREQRRWRADAWRAGLAVLAGTYRDRAVRPAGDPAGRTSARQALAALTLVEQAAQALVRNPNEQLLLEALLVRLSRLT